MQNKQMLQILSTESLFLFITWTDKFSLYMSPHKPEFITA